MDEDIKSEYGYDPVDRPKHYLEHPSGVQCIEIAEHHNFCIGNVLKYVWRAGGKDGVDGVEDLRKAAWYLQREIGRRVNEVTTGCNSR